MVLDNFGTGLSARKQVLIGTAAGLSLSSAVWIASPIEPNSISAAIQSSMSAGPSTYLPVIAGITVLVASVYLNPNPS